MSDDRPNPDDLLNKVQAAEAKQSRGKLKVFFGMAPGVGKTYAMLEAARKAGKEGADVIVGYVEPHARPETQALVLGLDVLERREVNYRGAKLYEFDLEAALARKPQLILVDELAHSNAEGSAHAKRWQDVMDLLDAGINVYSTLNVQHLNSLNDVVAKITGVAVQEMVPDWIFEQADEVELVDLAPDDLLERLNEGKVYIPEQAQRAIEHFFQKGNLIALREMALRQTALRVDAQMTEFRRDHDIQDTWPAAERLLVCVSPSPMSARLVRAARRMAMSFKAPWIALNVETPLSVRMSEQDRERLSQNMHLAEQLGGATAVVSGETVVEAVVKFARDRNVTKIIVGKPQQSRWRELLRGAYVYELTRKCGDIDVYVISGDQEAAQTELDRPTRRQALSPLPFVWAALVVLLCSVICWGLSLIGTSPINIVMVYLLGVIAVSLRFGRGPSLLTSLLGVLAFDFFFVPPVLTFVVEDTQYIFTFSVMLLTGVVISTLVSRLTFQAHAARQREQRTASLYAMSRKFSALQDRGPILEEAIRHTSEATDAQICILTADGKGNLQAAAVETSGFTPTEHDAGVAQWVYTHGAAAGLSTNTLPGAEALYLPLASTRGVLGVLGVKPKQPQRTFDTEQVHLLETLTWLIALALERTELAHQSEQRRVLVETERLRNSLLSAVSHDLRTPLAAISGASSTLLDSDQTLDHQSRRELIESIYDETHRLNRLVANLLDMTRLEGGGLAVKKEWQPLEEIVGVVLHRLSGRIGKHRIETNIPSDLPLAPFDDVLIQQVLINLLENALKFSPEDEPIQISAKASGQCLKVSIADFGPGISHGEKQRIFDKFYRSQINGAGRNGAGLGLAICRGIVELHGGNIWVENRPEHGAVFQFTIPIVGQAPRIPTESVN